MTISQDPSAPLVAVVGATGNQGGSVVNGLEESDKPYRVRAFTRDATKPAAQDLAKRGVEIAAVSLVVENKEEVYKAFAGADVAFLVTNYWEHGDKEREINEGKLLIDAAKSGGVSRILWSGLPYYNKISGGKLVHAYHFDSKGIVTEYARQSGVPFVELQAGLYGSLFNVVPVLLAKQDDGRFAMPWPVKPTLKIPYIDISRDYGLWARYLLELSTFPDGSSIVTHSEYITIQDMAQQLAKATGKEVVFKQISADQFRKNLEAAGSPPDVQAAFVDVWQGLADYGWPITSTTAVLHRPTTTWAEFAKKTDWSKTFV
ncbi:NAD(P)-binding protein [Mycena olivaceomarginata]|nr:NAD(P)-binding protein [Mycena olivaceomarginata]